ncbi:MAG: hypothetical protein ABI617_01715 [Sphingomicrobium sp.]
MAKYQPSRLLSLLAAAAIALPGVAVAQETPAPADAPEIAVDPAVQEEITVYYVGSIRDRDGAKSAENPKDAKLPALPVVYDDAPAAPAPVTPAA